MSIAAVDAIAAICAIAAIDVFATGDAKAACDAKATNDSIADNDSIAADEAARPGMLFGVSVGPVVAQLPPLGIWSGLQECKGRLNCRDRSQKIPGDLCLNLKLNCHKWGHAGTHSQIAGGNGGLDDEGPILAGNTSTCDDDAAEDSS